MAMFANCYFDWRLRDVNDGTSDHCGVEDAADAMMSCLSLSSLSPSLPSPSSSSSPSSSVIHHYHHRAEKTLRARWWNVGQFSLRRSSARYAEHLLTNFNIHKSSSSLGWIVGWWPVREKKTHHIPLFRKSRARSTNNNGLLDWPPKFFSQLLLF